MVRFRADIDTYKINIDMGYDSEDLEKKALKAIKAHSLIFVNEVVS